MLRRGRDRSTVCHGMSRQHSLVGSIALCMFSLYTMKTPNWTQCLDARRKVGATYISLNLTRRGKAPPRASPPRHDLSAVREEDPDRALITVEGLESLWVSAVSSFVISTTY